jgi:hypothetical protein
MIASVFAPMAAVLLVSFFLAKRNGEGLGFWLWNLFAWLVGFGTYQVAERLDSVFLGPTLLSVVVSALISYIWVLKKKFS